MGAARFWLTRIHRWTGLALVLFLVIVGSTGALLPFQGDIQHWLAPMPNASSIVGLRMRKVNTNRPFRRSASTAPNDFKLTHYRG